jgi:hypothetical protein
MIPLHGKFGKFVHQLDEAFPTRDGPMSEMELLDLVARVAELSRADRRRARLEFMRETFGNRSTALLIHLSGFSITETGSGSAGPYEWSLIDLQVDGETASGILLTDTQDRTPIRFEKKADAWMIDCMVGDSIVDMPILTAPLRPGAMDDQPPKDVAEREVESKTTRRSPDSFRDSKEYADLKNAQRLKLETVDRDLAVLEAALDRYMKDQEGTPPMTLDALVPRYVAELPTDAFATGKTAADENLGDYSPSLAGWGYRYRRRDKMAYAISSVNPLEVQTTDGSWEVRSVGLPDFPYRYRAANARGLYQRNGYWGHFRLDVF